MSVNQGNLIKISADQGNPIKISADQGNPIKIFANRENPGKIFINQINPENISRNQGSPSKVSVNLAGQVHLEKDFICYVCYRTFSRIGFLKAHFQRTHPNSPFPASLMTKPTPHELPYKKVSNIFNRKDATHTCEICKKTFSKKIELFKHAFVHRRFCITNPNNAIHKGNNLECSFCKEMFFKQCAYEAHVSKCELCTKLICPLSFEKKPCKMGAECCFCKINLCENCHNLHRELEVEEKTYECVVCQETFSSKKDVKDHYADAHALTKLSY